MKRERSGVVMLLIMLLIFSATLGMLHGGTQQKRTDSTGELGTLSSENALEFLTPLIESKSVDTLVDAMANIPATKARDLAEKIIKTHQAALTRDDLLKMLFGLVLHYSAQPDQYKILDLVAQEPLRKGAPLLYVAAMSDYAQGTPVLIAWMNKNAHDPYIGELVGDPIFKAYAFGITQNNLDALSTMHKQAARLTSKQATDLLWKVVTAGKKNPAIAQFLVLVAGAQVDDVRQGKTPLTQAAQHKNLGMVKALVQSGADVNKVASDAVGTALEIAIGNGATAIEIYLREHGASEER